MRDAAAIVRGFDVVFAAEEERYTREKHAKAARHESRPVALGRDPRLPAHRKLCEAGRC